MSAPSSAYIGKIQFKKGSSTEEYKIAKFLMGTQAQGGYIDSATYTSNSTTIANIKSAIKTLFHLDELLMFNHNDWNGRFSAQGFIGMVILGSTNAQYHRIISTSPQGTSLNSLRDKGGAFLKKNGVIYVLLNDAGLHTRGWGTAGFLYAFTNLVAGFASIRCPFYSTCKFTFKTSLNGSTWNTSNNSNINGSTYLAAKTAQTFLFKSLPGGSGQTVQWQLTSDNEEGQRADSGSVTTKNAVIMFAAEYFYSGTASMSSHSEIWNGNTTDGTRVMLCMFKADYDNFLSVCANQSWSRGTMTRVATSGAPLNIYPTTTFDLLYSRSSNTGNAYSSHAGFYMLTKDYGVYMNTAGQITFIFYAHECAVQNYLHIRIVVKFWKAYNSTLGKTVLQATVVAMYMEANTTTPLYNLNVYYTVKWAKVYQATHTAVNNAYFSNGNTQDYGDHTIDYTTGRSQMNTFLGFTDDLDVDGVAISSVQVHNSYGYTNLPYEIEYL